MGKKRRDGRAAKRGNNNYASSNASARNSDGGGLQHTTTAIRYGNNGTYEGELKDGKPHGEGTMEFDSGTYEGEFKDGAAHGKGTFEWNNGDVYVGDFVEGRANGKGTFKWKAGEVYVGEWKDGKQHGWGTKTLPSGKTYEGEWAEGKPHGEGTETLPTGEIYEGIWVKGELVRRKLRSERSQLRRLERGDTARQMCDYCGANDYHYKLRVCSGCNLALYCSAACQKAARGSHQRICDIVSHLPSRDSELLVLKYNRDHLVDINAGLRYATKYMGNLKHLAFNLTKMGKDDTVKLSAKNMSSLFRSKKGGLDYVSWQTLGNVHVPGVTENGDDNVWKELHGLKQLWLYNMKFDDAQCLHDIIGQQKNTLEVLSLPWLEIDWRKAKGRRALAQAVNSCKHLVKLDLNGGVLMDTDLKIMLHDLPNLRILDLRRKKRQTHEFTDNTCGLIARKCPGLQELNLMYHNHITVRGIRKIFEGCPNLLSFGTSTHKLSCKDIRSLLDIAPQLMSLSLDVGMHISEDELSRIIEVTGGRTVIEWIDDDIFEPRSISSKTREKYEHQKILLSDTWGRQADPECANEWEAMFEG